MKFPQKIEINVENELQASILYSCFNRTTNDVIDYLSKCNGHKDTFKEIQANFKNKKYGDDVEKFIDHYWNKVEKLFGAVKPNV
ncbi:MAG TPA: hypothetical protein DC057_10130 [Spirochaetia bacterium]|nr:hypothetical protein [Spirochaetia bacterium]